MRCNCLLLLILCTLLKDTDAAKTVGPFDTSLSDLRRCPEPSIGLDYTVKVQKMSRQKLGVFANISIKVPIDNELDVIVNLSKQTSQGWKENFFILEVPKACTVFRQYVPGLDKELGTQMKLPGNTCPNPVGNYSLELSLHISVGVFPVFPYGKYLTKVNLMKARKRIFCIIGLIDVIPKKSG